MTRNLNRLGLGTVQFGQAYGISNARGRVPEADVAAILRRADFIGHTSNSFLHCQRRR